MKWQALTAVVGSILVVVFISYVAVTATSESTPDVGGTFIEGTAGTPAAINPLLAVSDVDKDLTSLIFTGLTRVNRQGYVVPDLAEKWDISEDNLVYTFHLRRGVKWHDGTAFTADDVIFTIRAVQDPQFPGSPFVADLWKNAVVDKVDDYTVKLTLKDPFSPIIGYASVGILPAASFKGVAVKDMGNTAFRNQPIGTGPFKLAELTADYATLEANNAYYGEKTPFLSRIRFQFFSDYKSALTALRQKSIQGLAIDVMEDVPGLRESKELTTYETVRANYTAVFLNLKSVYFKDKNVRQALLYALDRQKIVNAAVGGLGFVAHSPIVPNTWAYKTDVKQYGYDPEKAKVLLDAAGWKLGADGVRAKDGTKMSFALLTNDDKSRIRCAEEVARQFRLLGIDVKVSASGYTGLIQNFLIPRKFDAILYGLSTGGDPDPYSWWHSTQAKPDGFNFSSFSNKRADDLLEAARQTSDRQKRIANYDEFQSIFADEVPSLLLYYPAYAYAIDSLVKGPDFGVIFDSSSRFLNITDWYVRTKRTMFMTK